MTTDEIISKLHSAVPMVGWFRIHLSMVDPAEIDAIARNSKDDARLLDSYFRLLRDEPAVTSRILNDERFTPDALANLLRASLDFEVTTRQASLLTAHLRLLEPERMIGLFSLLLKNPDDWRLAAYLLYSHHETILALGWRALLSEASVFLQIMKHLQKDDLDHMVKGKSDFYWVIIDVAMETNDLFVLSYLRSTERLFQEQYESRLDGKTRILLDELFEKEGPFGRERIKEIIQGVERNARIDAICYLRDREYVVKSDVRLITFWVSEIGAGAL